MVQPGSWGGEEGAPHLGCLHVCVLGRARMLAHPPLLRAAPGSCVHGPVCCGGWSRRSCTHRMRVSSLGVLRACSPRARAPSVHSLSRVLRACSFCMLFSHAPCMPSASTARTLSPRALCTLAACSMHALAACSMRALMQILCGCSLCTLRACPLASFTYALFSYSMHALTTRPVHALHRLSLHTRARSMHAWEHSQCSLVNVMQSLTCMFHAHPLHSPRTLSPHSPCARSPCNPCSLSSVRVLSESSTCSLARSVHALFARCMRALSAHPRACPLAPSVHVLSACSRHTLSTRMCMTCLHTPRMLSPHTSCTVSPHARSMTSLHTPRTLSLHVAHMPSCTLGAHALCSLSPHAPCMLTLHPLCMLYPRAPCTLSLHFACTLALHAPSVPSCMLRACFLGTLRARPLGHSGIALSVCAARALSCAPCMLPLHSACTLAPSTPACLPHAPCTLVPARKPLKQHPRKTGDGRGELRVGSIAN